MHWSAVACGLWSRAKSAVQGSSPVWRHTRVVYGFSSTLSMTVLLYMLSEEPGVRRMPLTLLPRRKDVIFGPAPRDSDPPRCETWRTATRTRVTVRVREFVLQQQVQKLRKRCQYDEYLPVCRGAGRRWRLGQDGLLRRKVRQPRPCGVRCGRWWPLRTSLRARLKPHLSSP